MNFFKKLLGSNKSSSEEAKMTRSFKSEINAKNEPKGLIRNVLLVTVSPVQLTNTELATIVMECLPNFEKKQDGTCKISFMQKTEPINLINDGPTLAIETFGKGILDASKYTYRGKQLKLKTGEAFIFVVYDADSR